MLSIRAGIMPTKSVSGQLRPFRQPPKQSEWRVNREATMIDRSGMLRTVKAMVICAVLAICIAAITLSAGRWSKWFPGDEPRLLVQPQSR